jgi:hypothetical protein
MATRVSDDDVRGILNSDLDISMAAFLQTANVMVTYVDSCDTRNLLSDDQLKQIEIWLAAHFYSVRDQLYSSNKTADAEADFQTGVKGEGSYDTTDYGRQAMALDITGCLANLNDQAKNGKRVASLNYLGKRVSRQIEYQDRD